MQDTINTVDKILPAKDPWPIMAEKVRELGGTFTRSSPNYLIHFPGTFEERRAKLEEAVRLTQISLRK